MEFGETTKLGRCGVGKSAAGSGAYLLGHVPGEPVKVHDFEPGQDGHVDQGHQDLQRGDEVGIRKVIIREDCLVEEGNRNRDSPISAPPRGSTDQYQNRAPQVLPRLIGPVLERVSAFGNSREAGHGPHYKWTVTIQAFGLGHPVPPSARRGAAALGCLD